MDSYLWSMDYSWSSLYFWWHLDLWLQFPALRNCSRKAMKEQIIDLHMQLCNLYVGLHVCDRNKRKTNIWKNPVATPHFWERFLQIADPCLFLWKLPRCEPKCPQLRSDIQPQALRICKKRTQKLLMFATGFFQIFVFLLFLSHTTEVYSNHHTVCMLYGIGW